MASFVKKRLHVTEKLCALVALHTTSGLKPVTSWSSCPPVYGPGPMPPGSLWNRSAVPNPRWCGSLLFSRESVASRPRAAVRVSSFSTPILLAEPTFVTPSSGWSAQLATAPREKKQPKLASFAHAGNAILRDSLRAPVAALGVAASRVGRALEACMARPTAVWGPVLPRDFRGLVLGCIDADSCK